MLNLYSVCGEWKSSENNQWTFLVDSDKGASLFEIDEDVKFKDLLEMVIEDFGIEDREVRLSYELPLRLKVFIKDSPPVFICNDRQLRSFINKVKEDPESIRLCVTVCDNDKHVSHENIGSNNQSVPLIVEHSRHIDVSHSHRYQQLCEVENIFSNVNARSNEEICVFENIQGRITQSLGGDSHFDLSHSNKQKQLLEVENIPAMHQSETHSRHIDHINQSSCEVGNVFFNVNTRSTEEIRVVENIQGRITQCFGSNSHLDLSHSNKKKQFLELENIPTMHQSGTRSRHGVHINQPLCEVESVFSNVNVGSTEEIRVVENIQGRITQSFGGNSHLDLSHSNKQKLLLEVENISAMHPSGTHSRHEDHINQPLCEVDQRFIVSDTCSFSPADREGYSSLLHPIPDLPPVPIGQSHSTRVTDDIYVKKHFKNKKEMMDRLRKYALERKFEFKSLWSNTTRVILGCMDDKCTWRLRASVVPHSELFVVKKFVDQHICDTTHRNPNHRQATATTLASLICSGYHEKKDGLTPKQIIDLVRMTHGVHIKYKKAWRTKELAETLVRGTADDSYHNLAKWLFKVQENNMGSKVFLEIDNDAKFKYAFLALGQSLRGFQHMRRVIAIDGTFLKAKFKGTLLGASAQDGNFHIYPLAFGIVDSENEDSWTWFLRGLKTVIPDGEDLVFLSDRAQSIASGLSTVYPLAHHGICKAHLIKNVKSQFGKKGLIPYVEAASNAYTRFEFHEIFSGIRISNPKLATYLEEADFNKWARSYAPANRYNIMTTNLVESLNSLLNLPREMPVVSLLETIRLTLTNWFYERSEKASKLEKYATPNVTEIIAGRYDEAMALDVYQVDEFEFEVKDDTHKYVVHLQNKHCTCNIFDIDMIPCVHAIAAAKRTRKDEYKLVDDFYTKEIWVKAYSESIHPCGDLGTCSYPDVLSDWFCGPPTTKPSSGRPPKKRKRAAGELGVHGSKSQGHKCSRCGIEGHNKSTCRNLI